MNDKPELMNLYWTTAGVFPGRGEISPYDFKDRVQAAAKAGFKGIGIWHTDLEHILVHRTLQEMKMILDDNGMKQVELEFLTDWFQDGGRKAESDSRKRRLLEASQALGAKHVKVGDFYNSPCSLPQTVEAFAKLCAEAEEYGARIGFEIMGCAMIDNIKDAAAMVEIRRGEKRRLDPRHIPGGESEDDFRGYPPHSTAVFIECRVERRNTARKPASRPVQPQILRGGRVRYPGPDPLRESHGIHRSVGGRSHIGETILVAVERTEHKGV